MEEREIDRCRPRLPDGLERIYQEESFHASLKQLRINILVAGLIYALFGILDAVVTPEIKYEAWFIRFAIVIPAAIFVFFFSFSRHFKKYQQPVVFSLVLVGGAGIVALIVIAGKSPSYFHFAGLLLVFMGAYTSFKLNFISATLAGWAIIGLYEISALGISHTPLPVFLTDNFFYIAANLMGMFSNYQRELYLRKEFVQNRRIKEIEQLRHAEEKDRLREAVDKAVQSHKESEARFRILAETTTASIVIHRGGRFLYTNSAVQLVTGYTWSELLQMEFWELAHPGYREMVRERGRARMSGNQAPQEYEFKIVTKRGEKRWVTTTAGIIDYEGSPAIIATLFDITDRKRAEEEKVKLYEERIREEERHLKEKESILMELHDGIGGITTNIGILSEVAQKSGDLAAVRGKLATISWLAREGVSEIRGFMRSLDTSQLSWHTLAAEVRNQGTTSLEPHNIAFSIETSIDEAAPGQPGSLLCVNLYKIYKEALTNIIKHAKATSVMVTLSIGRDALQLTVQDNGISCGPADPPGRGLPNMRKRAAELGGAMTLSSVHGTRLSLALPITFHHALPRTGV